MNEYIYRQLKEAYGKLIENDLKTVNILITFNIQFATDVLEKSGRGFDFIEAYCSLTGKPIDIEREDTAAVSAKVREILAEMVEFKRNNEAPQMLPVQPSMCTQSYDPPTEASMPRKSAFDRIKRWFRKKADSALPGDTNTKTDD